ncbi:helix-turn-helix domain-containing protein [Nocardia sp. NBC_01730]|uniref:helix-turn-helix domain-containing protein n=1 Tax=Nocardia sp. NBC_01730 TaxID=2975998 RepID=UPI002E1551C9|nr:helix-turn-helix domain-containing protein [Nocardia sp. NBC_01730]
MLHPPPVATADSVETSELAPESLRPWLAEFARIPTMLDLSEPLAQVPQTATTIVLRAEHAGTRDALVVGPQTKATYWRPNKPAGCVRLRLVPGAVRSLLGVPATDLTDRAVRLEDLPGPAADLAAELVELAPDEIIRYLEDELPRRIADDPAQRDHRHLLAAAVAAISADQPVPVPELAARLSVSERQLRNLFASGIGVSPKHFARIDRVRKVLSHAGTIPWAELAAANGYYDQSHMSADFRTLMGVPPTMFFRGRLPAPTPCKPLSKLH